MKLMHHARIDFGMIKARGWHIILIILKLESSQRVNGSWPRMVGMICDVVSGFDAQ